MGRGDPGDRGRGGRRSPGGAQDRGDIFQISPDGGRDGRRGLRADPGDGSSKVGRALRRDLPELAAYGAGGRVTRRERLYGLPAPAGADQRRGLVFGTGGTGG